MLANILAQLEIEKILRHKWIVQLSPYTNEHNDLNYILAPQLESGETVDLAGLARLHMDLKKLGQFIESRMRDAAAGELRSSA